MEYIIGILLLISFVGLAVYAVRGGNLMMGMLIMAIIWTVLPLIGNTFATNPYLLQRLNIPRPRMGLLEFKVRLFKANLFTRLGILQHSN